MGERRTADFGPRADGAGPREREGLPAWRLLRRVALCLVFLALLDAAVVRTVPPSGAFERDYRLPPGGEIGSLPAYADHIERMRADGATPTVVFIGASPTWGHGIRDAADTFPYAFERAARREGTPGAKAYNVSGDGWLPADEGYVLARLAGAGDAFVVQLTYHTFSPAAREPSPIREPGLPEALGVPVTSADAAALGLRPTPGIDLGAALRSWMRRRWALYRERDLIVRRVLGDGPERRLFRAWESARGAQTQGSVASQDGVAAFDSLPPARQMVVVARYARRSSFRARPGDVEVVSLRRMADLLRRHDKRAVFFVSPMNEDVIAAYKLIGPGRYAANLDVIRAAVGPDFPVLDYHDRPFLTSEDFSDISHTTAEGGRLTGERLWRDAGAYLLGRAPASTVTAGPAPGAGVSP
ncbi:MAG: hypothetical protein WC971_03810 [Coriobacteriia bacterium]